MASESEIFDLAGPLHLTPADWENSQHRMSVTACLVQGVYVLERDRQEKREGPQAFAPSWWEFFHFQLLRPLVDDVDHSIFGAIFQFNPSAMHSKHATDGSPRYVIAFRGTLTKHGSFSRDIELDLLFLQNGLHRTSRFEIAMQAVRNIVATVGDSDVWMAGHSLGSGMAMLAGKTMAKAGHFLESFLFNPPFVAAPIERIKDEKLKHGLRVARSVITAGLAFAMKAKSQRELPEDPFVALSAWVPSLFVHPADHLCSEYIGYFEHRRKMEEMGAGSIERLATQTSIGDLLMTAMGRETQAVHVIPSAKLVINASAAKDFKQAHGLHQWWQPDIQLRSKFYAYN